jgi:hypothetical protein
MGTPERMAGRSAGGGFIFQGSHSGIRDSSTKIKDGGTHGCSSKGMGVPQSWGWYAGGKPLMPSQRKPEREQGTGTAYKHITPPPFFLSPCLRNSLPPGPIHSEQVHEKVPWGHCFGTKQVEKMKEEQVELQSSKSFVLWAEGTCGQGLSQHSLPCSGHSED